MKYNEIDERIKNELKRDWIITNGIGGFCSQSALGCNTRKYHGLLVAPLTPPARRYLILSKLDESIETNGKKYNLFTNVANGDISEGYKYLTEFKKEYIPIFTYKVEDITIKKFICMEYGKNTVVVLYKIKNQNAESRLTLAPVMNFRDFHSMNHDHCFKAKQTHFNNKLRVILEDNSSTPVYMTCSDGKYLKHTNDIFYNMYYLREEERGFETEENHYVPGVYNINLAPNEEKDITFVCSLEENIDELDGVNVINKELLRLTGIIYDTGILQSSKMNDKNLDMIKTLVLATDNFIVNRPSFGLHTIIAGYPWFLDWGRDSLIAFEGLLLKTKRYDIAKEVILTMVRDIKYGLVPNGYSGFDNRPLYNSVDASLLLFEQIQKYLNYTGDYEFIKENVYEKLEKVIDNYIKGIDIDNNNIYLDEDYLISSGTENTQNTWMDAKCNGIAATPRNGKAVEINSLWYNSLMIMADLTDKMGNKSDIKKYKDLARKCKKSFNEKFYNPKRKCLYDVLGDNKIRPNQLFSLSLTYPVVEPNSEEAYNIVNIVEKKLLNNYGLKSLAKGEPNYIEIYEGDSFKRDMSYHQGITWTWLLGLYYDALRNMIKAEKRKTYKTKLEDKLKTFVEKTTKTFEKEVGQRGCIGSIAEIYDSTKPYAPKGAIAQGWSVAEILRIVTD